MVLRLLSCCAVLVAAGAAHAQLVPADRFSVTGALGEVAISNLAGTLASDQDSVLATASAGGNVASVNHADGLLRGRATIADAFADSLLSFASYGVQFQNISGRAALLDGDGDLTLEVSAAFARTLGAGMGMAGNTLAATFAAVVVDSLDRVVYEGAGSIAYTATFESGDVEADIGFTPTLIGGFRLGPDDRGADALQVSIIAPELLLQPGDRLALAVNVTGTASGFSFDGSLGYSALTDFGNSARLRLALPAGFSLQSDLPLNWVSTTAVPEPSVALLLALGLAGLAWRTRQRRPMPGRA